MNNKKYFSSNILHFANLVFISIVFTSGNVYAERQLAKHKEFSALLDTGQECDDNMTVVVKHPDQLAFVQQKVDLQRLLGGVRVSLSMECPQAKELVILGKASNEIVYKGVFSSETDWVLIDTPDVSSTIISKNTQPKDWLEGIGDEEIVKPSDVDLSDDKILELNILENSYDNSKSNTDVIRQLDEGAIFHENSLVVYYNPAGMSKEEEVSKSASKIIELALFKAYPNLLKDTWWTAKLVKHLPLSEQKNYSGNYIGGGSYSWQEGGWKGENEFEFKESYKRFLKEKVPELLPKAPELPLRASRVAAIELGAYDTTKQQFKIKRLQSHFTGKNSALLPEIEGLDETLLGFELVKTISYPPEAAKELLKGKRSIRLYEVITFELIKVNTRFVEYSKLNSETDKKLKRNQVSFVSKPISSDLYFDKNLTNKFKSLDVNHIASWSDGNSQLKQDATLPMPLNWDTISLIFLRDHPDEVRDEMYDRWLLRRARLENKLWEISDTWKNQEPWQPFFSQTTTVKINSENRVNFDLKDMFKKWSRLRADNLNLEVSMPIKNWNNQGSKANHISFGMIARNGEKHNGVNETRGQPLNSSQRQAIRKLYGKDWIVEGTWFGEQEEFMGAYVFEGIYPEEEFEIQNLQQGYQFELISEIADTSLTDITEYDHRRLFIVSLEPKLLVVKDEHGQTLQTINFNKHQAQKEQEYTEKIKALPTINLNILGVKLGMSIEEAISVLSSKDFMSSDRPTSGLRVDPCEYTRKKLDKSLTKQEKANKLEKLCKGQYYPLYEVGFYSKKNYAGGGMDSVSVFISGNPRYKGKVVAIARIFEDKSGSIDFLSKLKELYGKETYTGLSEYEADKFNLNFWLESYDQHYRIMNDKQTAESCLPKGSGPKWPLNNGIGQFNFTGFEMACGQIMGYRYLSSYGQHDLFLVDSNYNIDSIRESEKLFQEARKSTSDLLEQDVSF